MKYTRASLIEKLTDMGIPVVAGRVKKSDVKRVLSERAARTIYDLEGKFNKSKLVSTLTNSLLSLGLEYHPARDTATWDNGTESDSPGGIEVEYDRGDRTIVIEMTEPQDGTILSGIEKAVESALNSIGVDYDKSR